LGLSLKKALLLLSGLGLAGGMAFARKAPKPAPAPKEDPKSEYYEPPADSINKNFDVVRDL